MRLEKINLRSKTREGSQKKLAVPEKLTEKERIDKFRERLKQFIPVFLEAREKMGLGESVGFGFLEKVHDGGDSIGSLPEIKITKKGEMKYSVPGLFTDVKLENTSDDDLKNILIMPEFSKKSRVVSIFDPYELWQSDWANLLDARDDVFIGAIVHELAHEFDYGFKLPPEIISTIRERHQKENPDFSGKWRYNIGSEEEIDLIASLFGYKKEIVSKIDFILERLKKFGPYAKKGWIIKELTRRKEQVLKYCP